MTSFTSRCERRRPRAPTLERARNPAQAVFALAGGPSTTRRASDDSILTCKSASSVAAYFHAAFSKMQGPEWVDGTAMYHWLSNPIVEAPRLRASAAWSRWSALTAAALACSCGQASSAVGARPPAATTIDENTQLCHDFVAQLVAGSAELAEKNFDQRMREQLPPSLLSARWHGLLEKYGAFSSFRIVKRDALYEKDRFTLELQFAQGILYALVVFDAQGEIVGLFFSARRSPVTAPPAPLPQASQGSEIEVEVGPLSLRGALVLPAQASRAPVPGVVFVAGSGPSDRDETVLGVKPFRDLALGLAARGIASLRFDKRTFARPESFKSGSVTVESETIEDAIAAVGVLRARPEVDAQRLVVLGHSLGALLAPEIAARAGNVTALVLLAAPGRPLPILILEQLGARKGTKPGELSALAAKVQALPTLPPNELVLGVPASYWQDLAKRDEFAAARALGRPVLLLRGTEDQQVASVDQDRWLKELAGHVPLESASLPGLTHLFIQQGAAVDTAPHVSDTVVERIAAFVRARPVNGL